MKKRYISLAVSLSLFNSFSSYANFSTTELVDKTFFIGMAKDDNKCLTKSFTFENCAKVDSSQEVVKQLFSFHHDGKIRLALNDYALKDKCLNNHFGTLLWEDCSANKFTQIFTVTQVSLRSEDTFIVKQADHCLEADKNHTSAHMNNCNNNELQQVSPKLVADFIDLEFTNQNRGLVDAELVVSKASHSGYVHHGYQPGLRRIHLAQ